MERQQIHRTSWADRTQSILTDDKQNACSERLSRLCGHSLYGKASGQSWYGAYEASYFAAENGDRRAFTPAALRYAVKKQLPEEMSLLSGREEALLQRMLIFEGKTRLLSRDECGPAESLVKRLWCAVALDDEGAFWIRLHKPLIPPMLSAAAKDGFPEKRRRIFALEATIHSLLYLHGVLYAEPTVSGFIESVLRAETPFTRTLVTRCLMAEFDYTFDRQGNMLLVHDGLAEPGSVLPVLTQPLFQDQNFTMQMILGGMNEMLSEEAPAVEALQIQLRRTLQPEYSAQAICNDLKLLAKQGAPLDVLRDLVRDRLLVTMPQQLENALRRLYQDTVRWEGVASARMN